MSKDFDLPGGLSARARDGVVRGREYLRVSFDPSGRERSTTEQHTENERASARRGVELLRPPYVDQSISASRYSTKVRDDFLRLIADLAEGRFGAEELWLWESSRGSRRVGEWVELIELCEKQGVKIYVTTHDRLYDPANPRDRRSLLEDAVDSEYESAKISLRARRASAASAAEGRPNGRCPYGYQRLYDPRTGRQVKQVPHPVESMAVAELYERLYNGHSLRSIAKHFEREGIQSRGGRSLSQQVLRDMALNPAYAGWRTHSAGRIPRTRRLEQCSRYEATWPALVDRTVWLEVYRRLTAPERKTSKPGRGKHLLSMIARCDVCDSPLAASYRLYGSRGNNKVRTYQCRAASHVRVPADLLDAYAEEAMLAWLVRPDVHGKWASDQGADGRLDRLRSELAEARVELDRLRSAATDRKITVETLLAVEPALAGRVAALETQEADLTVPSALRPFLDPAAEARTAWKNAPMSARRELARLLLSPDVLGQLRLMKPPAKGMPRQDNQFTGALPVAYRTQFRGRDFTRGPEPPLGSCTVDGCDKPYYARGLCKMHHQREWKRQRQARTKAAA